ncbi:MAG: ATP-binding protein [Polyangiales bacterium]
MTDGAEPTTRTIDRDLLVGRARDCDLTIADQRLSRHHARLSIVEGRLWVEDLGGPNGTTVNERAIRGRVPLSPGDVVGIGKSRITVLSKEGSAPARRLLRQAPDPAQRPELVKPITVAPVLGGKSAAEYFTSVGIGDETIDGKRADSLEAIVRRARDFAVLHEMSRAIQSEREGPPMLQRVLGLLLEVITCERGFAALLDDKGELQLHAVRASDGASPISRPSVLSHTVAEHVLDRGLAVICSDAAVDTRFRDATSLIRSETRSLMAVPILAQNRVLGIIQLESSQPVRRFTERDLDLLSVVASTVGVALDNLDLLDRRARTIRELEAAQAELLATQERLVRTEQLATIGRLAAGIAHEVRNHLSPFTLASVIAERHPDDRQLQEVTEMMNEAQEHILELVNQVRAFAQGAETTGERSPHDVAEVTKSVLRFLRYDRSMRGASVSLDADGPHVANLDVRSFRQVLVNLIRNATQAAPGVDGRIEVRVFGKAEEVFVEVSDNGPGIPADVAARIFEPFFTTKGEQGLGLGLDISRKIVIDHGGLLTFESEVGKGTTFRIALPIHAQGETG